MTPDVFEQTLRSDGYTEIETKAYGARAPNTEHGHAFAVRGLVLEGRFIVWQDQHPVAYGPGEMFAVAKDRPHSEEIGPEGARVLVGRKY